MSDNNSDFYYHVPVMSDESITYLCCHPGKTYVDCTLGGGGHSSRILKAIAPDGKLIAIDQDLSAIENAQNSLNDKNCVLVHDNFKHIRQILNQSYVDAVDGILADLGLSLFHIRQSGRGFSFMSDEPLDMRMNTNDSLTARQLIHSLPEKKLAAIFRNYGEERFSNQIARAIVKERKYQSIETTQQLCAIIHKVIPHKIKARQKIHPATRVFMALRIAVNDELSGLQHFLDNVLSCLNPGGRLCIISFHSLEDRMVKQAMKQWESPCTCPKDLPVCLCQKEPSGKIIVRKGITPEHHEIQTNPMARSARMRVFEKRAL